MMTGDTRDPNPTEADIDAVLEDFSGDARAAIRALLHDLAVLAGDYESSVSKGYVRGRLAAVRKLRTNAGGSGR
jgi:hypothetical protein